MGAGRRVLAAFGSRLNRRGRLSDWSMAVKQGALVLSRDKTSRPFITTPFDTEHSEMSIGEVLVLPPAYSSDAKEVTKVRNSVVMCQVVLWKGALKLVYISEYFIRRGN